jgi:hypothetical protein
MAINWTNNFNDEQSTDTIQAGLSANLAYNATTAYLSSFAQYDSDGAGIGPNNWVVGDTFTFAGSASNLYEITAITHNSTSEAIVTYTPGVVDSITVKGTLITKEDSYKGNHSSAKEHLRKRNQGSI